MRLQLGSTTEFQIAFTQLQLNRQWIKVSGSFSQIGQVESKGIPLWFKFCVCLFIFSTQK